MTELALPPLVAMPAFVKLTQHGLGVDSKWHLLDLDGFEQLSGLFLSGFGRKLLFLALLFRGLLLLLIRCATRSV